MSIIAKYKFDSSIYADLIPEFNSEFTSDLYTVTDEVDSENSNYIIRTIESVNGDLPTLMRFGYNGDDTESHEYDGHGMALLKVYDMDTKELTTGYRMFKYCKRVESINANWDTSNMTNMFAMFYNCNNLTSLDLSNFNTDKVTNMRSMFWGCNNLTSLDVSNFDTSKVTDMCQMFSNCNKLTSLDVSNWDTSNITDFTNILASTSSLQYIRCNNVATINSLSTHLYDRTSTTEGKIITTTSTDINTDTLSILNWTVDTSDGTKIAEYKFDKNIYSSLIPEFNSGFSGYFCNDAIEDNIVTREIIGYGGLPTLMRFGRLQIGGESNTDSRTDSLLEVLDMNTSGLTSCSSMFRYNTNLTSITCEWDTSNVTDMKSMFAYCNNLTTLDVSNFNTSKVTTLRSIFYNCQVLISLDVSNWDTINVTTMQGMFYNCYKLISLDVSNFNTSKVTDMHSMFYYCTNLTSLDLSNFDTSKVTNIKDMFQHCTNLTSLDISNWNTSNITSIASIFYNTPLLTDIGMLYCDQSTINKIASLLPTDITQTIWVEDVDIKDLTPVEGVEFKQYAKNTEVMLTSPLLEGDKLIVKDGKLYHYHKMCKVALDGSEDWNKLNIDTSLIDFPVFAITNLAYEAKLSTKVISDKIPSSNEFHVLAAQGYFSIGTHSTKNDIRVCIEANKLATSDANGFKQWLSENPTTVVYELAESYYELISDEPLDISLIAESSDITNSSNIPLNMTINNKGLATIAMSPSTTYTVAFDKDANSEVVVNLCGNEITTTDNIVEITTPSEIDDELIFYGDGIEVSNVRLLEGSMSEDSVPRETFEGLKNSFEDNYTVLTKDNVVGMYINESNGAIIEDPAYKRLWVLEANVGETIKITRPSNTNSKINIASYTSYPADGLEPLSGSFIRNNTDSNPVSYTVPDGAKYVAVQLWRNNDVLNGVTMSYSNDTDEFIDWTIRNFKVEGDKLIGKYKVEYKVTGKNKFSSGLVLGNLYTMGDDISMGSLISSNQHVTSNDFIKIQPNTSYYVSATGTYDTVLGTVICWYDKDKKGISYTNKTGMSPSNAEYCKIRFRKEDNSEINISELSNVNPQIEEGTEATEYEPYKSYTKTFYLNSPLLEGDTIEDVNGVATHVKRYDKVVLDGSESWNYWSENTQLSEDFISFYAHPFDNYKQNIEYKLICNTLNDYSHTLFYRNITSNSVALNGDKQISLQIAIRKTDLSTQDVEGFKQWLQANPTTVVYQLASPIYEPISTESILCDSYVNGHLDFDSNVPIEKVQFLYWYIPVTYIQDNTTYILQFESDNVGKCDWASIGGTRKFNIPITKGMNRISITTTTNSNRVIGFSGIGFNASNIQVVATDRDVDFGYFKGLQSSFESKLVTDEADENYGKYKVECKVTGKNLIDKWIKGYVNPTNGTPDTTTSNAIRTDYIKLDSNLTYSISGIDKKYMSFVSFYDKDKKWLCRTSGKCTSSWSIYKGYSLSDTDILGDYEYIIVTHYNITEDIDTFIKNNTIQLEEGTQATSYEPYQEYTKTIYLNSSLLKGDTIEVHNGKLCHYHKMGKVVLDGSEGWNILKNDDWISTRYMHTLWGTVKPQKLTSLDKGERYCNFYETGYNSNGNSIRLSINNYVYIFDSRNLSLEEFKQWLSENPVTVIYELASPYYEEIEPTQEDLIITSVKEGDLHIDTIVPIFSKVTYNVNVQLLTDFEQSIVEQVQTTQTTDLQSILDEEIDN